jgi:hypothetical protein
MILLCDINIRYTGIGRPGSPVPKCVASRMIRPCNLKAERKRQPCHPLLMRLTARVRYWALGVIQAATLIGMDWLE